MKHIRTLILTFLMAAGTATAQNDITVHDDRNGNDELITLPEGLSAEADSLLKTWQAKKYLYPDTTCVDSDVRPSFSDAVYQDRLRRLPTIIEMPYNSIVRQFIDEYSDKRREQVAFMLGAGNFYIPIFEEALDYYGLPLELKYLPVVESALNPTAVSRAGAVGLWQFMLTTAERYDLKVNSLVDERRDPVKSTWAAAKYLKDLYQVFGDWNLVLAAYNCGPQQVNKAIHRADGAKDYWTIYPYLPKETRGYVPAFIAANYIMTYYCEHNICPMKTRYPVTTDTIMVSRDVHVRQIADLCKIDAEAIRALNPQYRTDIIPGRSELSAIRLPQETAVAFIDWKDSIYNYRAEELLTRRARVEVAETSRPATTTTSATRKKSSRSSSSSRRRSSSRPRTATVRKGDTLSEIAKRNGTTVSKLRRLNRIKGNLIKPGQKLRVR